MAIPILFEVITDVKKAADELKALEKQTSSNKSKIKNEEQSVKLLQQKVKTETEYIRLLKQEEYLIDRINRKQAGHITKILDRGRLIGNDFRKGYIGQKLNSQNSATATFLGSALGSSTGTSQVANQIENLTNNLGTLQPTGQTINGIPVMSTDTPKKKVSKVKPVKSIWNRLEGKLVKSALAYTSINKLMQVPRAVADYAGEVIGGATDIGVTAQQYQGLQNNGLTDAYGEFLSSKQRALGGDKDAKQAFSNMGIDLQAGTSIEQFKKLGEALKKSSNDTQDLKTSVEIFGKTAAEAKAKLEKGNPNLNPGGPFNLSNENASAMGYAGKAIGKVVNGAKSLAGNITGRIIRLATEHESSGAGAGNALGNFLGPVGGLIGAAAGWAFSKKGLQPTKTEYDAEQKAILENKQNIQNMETFKPQLIDVNDLPSANNFDQMGLYQGSSSSSNIATEQLNELKSIVDGVGQVKDSIDKLPGKI